MGLLSRAWRAAAKRAPKEWDTGRVLYRDQPARFAELPEHGVYTTANPKYAAPDGSYYHGQLALPLFQKRGLRILELPPKEIEDIGYNPARIAELRAQGYDGVRGVDSPGYGASEQVFIFDRDNLANAFDVLGGAA